MQVTINWVVETILGKIGSIIFTGPNGVGKTLLASQAAEKALKQGRKVIYALTTMAPQNFIDLAGSVSIDFRDYLSNDSMVIVDCHTRGEKTPFAKYTVSPESSLLEIRQKFLEAADYSDNFFLVIDDLSTLLAYVQSENAFKFYQAVASDVRRSNATSVAVIVPEILEQKLTNLLYSLSDGVVEMTMEEMGGNLRRFLRIRFLRGVRHPTEWIEYIIGLKGIELIV
ncbi:MAG: RAD55 family ATPase [Candidatus Caldarchaeum sp.]|nr:RAD55 family ATPase [Candidatus Caldarchaeum sp.]MCX8201006.1 RAD55 family ATPase [Candidatus Caldarchaeum sp.]MDW8062842.1 RAD55 family ATPase [Candidatus Caldarchaeum sp.]MDW8435233.1 RAD55 family ATPase [Candidatus Caldarchaeum sp.]